MLPHFRPHEPQIWRDDEMNALHSKMLSVQCVYPNGEEFAFFVQVMTLPEMVRMHKQQKLECTLIVNGEVVHKGINNQNKNDEAN